MGSGIKVSSLMKQLLLLVLWVKLFCELHVSDTMHSLTQCTHTRVANHVGCQREIWQEL